MERGAKRLLGSLVLMRVREGVRCVEKDWVEDFGGGA